MADELRGDLNQSYRLVRRMFGEMWALAIAVASLIIALLSLILMLVYKGDVADAKAQTAHWQNVYKEAEREDRLCQLEVDEFRIALIRAGIELDHGEEKP